MPIFTTPRSWNCRFLLQRNWIGALIVNLLLILTSACSVNRVALTKATPTSLAGSAITKTAMPTVTATFTRSPTPTFTATATPTLTVTPTPSFTPTPDLPVREGTPFPHPSAKISAENVAGLRQLAAYGSPVVRDFQITADGKLAYVATTDGVKIYTVENWQQINQINIAIRQDPRGAMSLSQDGSRFAIDTGEDMQVLNKDGEVLLRLPIGAYYSEAMLSPNGEMLAASDCENWATCVSQIINVADGKVIEGAPSFDGEDFTFSPDSSYFAARSRSTCIRCTSSGVIWRTSDWSKVSDLYLTGNMSFAGFSPNGSQFVINKPNQQVEIYRTEDGKLVRMIKPTGYRVDYLVFSPDGEKIAFETDYPTVKAWNIADGKILGEIELHSPYAEIRLSNDGQLSLIELPVEELNFGTDNRGIRKLIFLKDKSGLKVLEHFRSVCTIPWEGMSECGELEYKEWPVRGDYFVASPSGDIFIVRHHEQGNAIDIFTQGNLETPLQTIHSEAGCYPLTISPDGKFLVCVAGSQSSLYDLTTGNLLKKWSGGADSAVFSSDQDYLALVLSHQSGNSFNLETGFSLLVYDLPGQRVAYDKVIPILQTPLSFMPGSNLLVYSQIENNPGGNGGNVRIAFLDIKQKKIVNFFTLKDLPEVGESHGGFREVEALSLSPDATLAAIGFYDGSIYVINNSDGSVVHLWRAHMVKIADLAFSSDGTLLATSGWDGFIRIWGVWP